MSQVTDCYKVENSGIARALRACNRVLLGLVVVVLAGCGSSSTPVRTTGVELEGWRSQPDEPGIAQLAPDLGGLDVASTVARPALVRNGDAIRSLTFTFGDEQDAREALKRGAGDDYESDLEVTFRADATRKEGGIRLVVARPAEAGTDTVEIYLVRRGRSVSIVELLSNNGFPPELLRRAIAAVSR